MTHPSASKPASSWRLAHQARALPLLQVPPLLFGRALQPASRYLPQRLLRDARVRLPDQQRRVGVRARPARLVCAQLAHAVGQVDRRPLPVDHVGVRTAVALAAAAAGRGDRTPRVSGGGGAAESREPGEGRRPAAVPCLVPDRLAGASRVST
eukprot:6170082-Prymnesium_polylepis.1